MSKNNNIPFNQRREFEINAAWLTIYQPVRSKRKPAKPREMSKALEKELVDNKVRMKNHRANDKHVRVLEPISDKYQSALPHYLRVWARSCSMSLIKHVDSMSSMAPILRELAQAGFHKRQDHLLPDEESSSFRLYLARDEYTLDITGEIALDRGLCKKVQTGTETREVPVYKIECPDGADKI